MFETESVHQAVLDCWSNIFKGKRDPIFTNSQNPVDIVQNEIQNLLNSSFQIFDPCTHEEVVCRPFTQGSVKECLSKLKTGKSSGFDNVPAESLKNCGPKYLEYLLLFYNKILSSGIIPPELNIGKCLLLPKGGDSLNASNYRPITVPSCFLRVLTQRMCKDMTSISERHKLIGIL